MSLLLSTLDNSPEEFWDRYFVFAGQNESSRLEAERILKEYGPNLTIGEAQAIRRYEQWKTNPISESHE
jgi:hypothetical protein